MGAMFSDGRIASTVEGEGTCQVLFLSERHQKWEE